MEDGVYNTINMHSIKIGNKFIGKNNPVFIIAEAGVNHNGRLDLALKLINAAKKAGADAIKFQTFKAEDVVTTQGEMTEYQKKNIGKSESQLEMIKKFELRRGWSKIAKYCKKKNIMFLSTPHGGFNSIDLLESLSVPAFKFGSGDLTSLPLLEYAARLNKPIILGTGMATLAEVKKSIQCIKKTGNKKIIALHCTTNYPCQLNEVNLKATQTMMKKLGVLIGYSDHTLGTQVPIMAATMNACIIEKHFTLSKKMSGPDHKASLEPKELKQMVDEIRNVEIILGKDIKRPVKNELKYIPLVRRSLVALKDIKKEEVLSKDNIGIKRPGTGIKPKNYFNILGKRAKKNIKADKLIKKNDYL